MSSAAQEISVMALPEREFRVRDAMLLVACAAVDAVAAVLLLVSTPLPLSVELLVAAIAHGIAVLLLSTTSAVRPSRRWLSVAALMVVPFVGVAVASALMFTSGRGLVMKRSVARARRRPAATRTALRRLGSALSPYEALECGDEEQRRAALAKLARRRDPEAITLLKRTAASRDPDLALSAALVLDEIRERAERRLSRLAASEVRHGTG
jgi:phosphate/sulfate permease